MKGDLFLFDDDNKNNVTFINDMLTIKEASQWATEYLKKKISISNISYLIQYGKIKKYGNNGKVLINKTELKNYYDTVSKEKVWINSLGQDINWHLSFSQYKECERTKHVHRLHPYKGKFIPQLVEYFLDSHIDEFKKNIYFKKGDIILDPFCGSGTTLVQANELGLHGIGIDISSFNVLISEVKVEKHNLQLIKKEIEELTLKLKKFQENQNNIAFEEELSKELLEFNNKYFCLNKFNKNHSNDIIKKEEEFLKIYYKLLEKYKIILFKDKIETFLDKWFLLPVRKELEYLSNEIKMINDNNIKKVIMLILSRTARSCRATTHADLATLKDPIRTPYFCRKHRKICKPIFSINKWWEYYCIDTLNRLIEFDKLRINTFQICLVGDSRYIDIYEEIKNRNIEFYELLKSQNIKGIFSSPPYVGLIDYHEQHAYAYELFGLERKDNAEIGALSKGQGKKQRDLYVDDISKVLINCKKYLQKDYDIFLVANDKYNLYPTIAKLAGMRIVDKFNRPVLNRVEKDRDRPYSETIFHLKDK